MPEAIEPPPLYDPGFEHDACGVGFVADSGGRGRDRVLRLALDGLSALGHRGAFAADGESSDGAGVALPLEPALADLIAPGMGGRPGVVMAFLPGDRPGLGRARVAIDESLAEERLVVAGRRSVPVDPGALGASAAASRPLVEQVVIERPRGWTSDRFELALAIARRRFESKVRAAGPDGAAIASASSRVVVYKGLVAGSRLADLYPDLQASIPLTHAVFHQRYATNTHPTWDLAQPFRWISHNGEIDTVRGNRSQVSGRAGDPVRPSAGRRILDAGPLLSAGGSDSRSLDEMLEVLVLTGWDPFVALLSLVPEAPGLRAEGNPLSVAHARRVAGFLAPWDGPAAIILTDGRRVGALLDRNGLRSLAYAVTRDGLVAAASEAGAVPLRAAETVRRGRLGPGELLLVDPAAGLVLEDHDARTEVLRHGWIPGAPRGSYVDRPDADVGAAGTRPTPTWRRFEAGLDGERFRLHLRTMILEGHEPVWSMGDDTPLPGQARIHRPVSDYLHQAFAQVTNPPIDPIRERAVISLAGALGPRPPLLGGMPDPRRRRSVRIPVPFVADLDGLLDASGLRWRRLDASWSSGDAIGEGLRAAVSRLADEALAASVDGVELLVVSDLGVSPDRLSVPSVLAVGAVDAALTRAGLRGRTDVILDAADVLDVHVAAMSLAVGASAIRPRLAIECAAELAGTRGAEELTAAEAVERLLEAFASGLRKTLARMGISTASSYVGGAVIEALELAPEVLETCFPDAAAWPGTSGFDVLERQLRRRRDEAMAIPDATPAARLPDPGLARFRSDGEHHGYAPTVVRAVQALAGSDDPGSLDPAAPGEPLVAYRTALGRAPATAREQLAFRRRAVLPLDEVEDARSIVRRFVASAMSVGALSPEAHQAVTLGMQRAGGAANTGEGGEDPAWYLPGPDGERRDARIKQVASGRFGVTAAYLARADQLEIKIAQGSKPGEGGHLPARKATAHIAALRRGQAGQDYISPPPHHDIYSIEDLAQLIADLRAVTPTARIGVKLVATRGIGTIASGVVKAGADYVHVAGHAGGTGASPLASIKHVGVPWELGLAEAHQVLLWNGLRDRVALRTDGGLRTGRDVLVAALLGAEEFAFGTPLLVALGCDMARQCHLDTCPTGVATQRADLRAKFAGTPAMVERFVLALAEDVRRELSGIGARSIGEVIGEASRFLRPSPAGGTLDVKPLLAAPRWPASTARRADPTASVAAAGDRPPSSRVEEAVAAAIAAHAQVPREPLPITTADRGFGALLTGRRERGELPGAEAGPVRLRLAGAAGQSFGAFLGSGVELRLEGVANDYVGKGLSGGRIVVAPDPDLGAPPDRNAIVGNTCLYGATAGQLHVVGRAGMRFAVRNSGARAVVEGLGPHGCEYMTGGTVVVLGPVGRNFGAGMTGGRAFLWDVTGRPPGMLDDRSVWAMSLAEVRASRPDAPVLGAELDELVAAHAAAGSALAEHLLATGGLDPRAVWVVEPAGAASDGAVVRTPQRQASGATQPQPAGISSVADTGTGKA